MIGNGPFTLLVMKPTNDELHRKAEQLNHPSGREVVVSEQEEQSVKQLIDRWGSLNLMRSCLPILGCLVGCWATFDMYEELIGITTVALEGLERGVQGQA